ncbi:unnamed protein product [Rhizopus stolonifer]
MPADPTRRTSSLLSSSKRSSVSSFTKTLSRLGKRTSTVEENPVFEDDEEEDPEEYAGQPTIPNTMTSEHFGRYEIMTEFINLKNQNHCPLGVYVMPSSNNLYVWHGVLFVHKGYFRSGTFRFQLNIPKDYPNSPPSVTFFKDVFHPLVDDHGNVCILQQFPKWRPYQDYVFHVLHYLKNMFKKVVLDGLNEKYCLNKESYRLYRTDKPIFHKLAQQCAQLSITESFLFEHVPDDNMIRFSPLSESKFDELKSQLLRTTLPPLNDE